MVYEVGVGSTIGGWLQDWGITKKEGCSCDALQYEMDKAGPEEVFKELDLWSKRLKKSAEEWKHLPDERGNTHEHWVLPPLFVFRQLVSRACTTVKRLEDGPDVSVYERVGTSDISVLITYYKRPEDLKRLVNSIPPKYTILIQDTEGNLSWGRNRLIERCKTKYALICEDDMEFTEETHIEHLMEVLEKDPSIWFAAGFVDDGHKQWHHNISIRDKKVYSEYSWDVHEIEGLTYIKCDLSKNFALTYTDLAAEHKWDEELELSEHYDWFLRLWYKSPQHVAFVPSCKIQHYNSRPTELYKTARKRSWPMHIRAEEKHGLTILEPTGD